jgi:hypothetical protein
MKKVIALGLATVFSISLHADQQTQNYARTFLRFETPFQSASPERLALFNTEDVREKHRANHHGDVQFVVFGGQNSNWADAAAYYMPGGLQSLTFNAAIDNLNQGTDTAVTYWTGAIGGVNKVQFASSVGNVQAGYSTAAGTAGAIPFTLAGTATANALAFYDNTATANPLINVTGGTGAVAPYSIPTGPDQFVVGTGVAGVSNTYDLSVVQGFVDNTGTGIGNFTVDTNKNIGIIRPWNFGIGYAPNVQMGYNISESAFVSTISPELKRSHWDIGATWKQILSEKDTGFFLELSTVLQSVTLNMELNENIIEALNADPATNDPAAGYAASWTPYDAGDVTPPTSVAQAFAQSAWAYGRIDGAQSVTRLADIELKLGYQFICEDNVMSNAFIGIVIPTGNKAQSLFLAEPIVGNGFHFGLMFGSTSEIQLDMGTETRWSMRSDANFRYLFQNTQVRSFDTESNGQWSRYMMVWPNYATEQSDGELGTQLRNYTPGINLFTQEMYVTPGAQARMNQAIVVETGSFKGEFGWNMLVRQSEKVSLVNAWVDNSVAFVDASNNLSSLYNQTRTIYNDSYQSTPEANSIPNGSENFYNAASISASDLDLSSAASPAIFTNTPYMALGYAFNEEKSSVFSIGISYEVAATNGYINDWTLWGKFGFSF